jgi:type II secretory pathway pseudopilin PulG
LTLLELTVALAVFAILAGGVMLGFRQIERRALYTASMQLQADMRDAQRRAIIEGREFIIRFDTANNLYRIVSTQPEITERTVHFTSGVRLDAVGTESLTFHPRGTTAATTILLTQGNRTQRITTTVSGGRVLMYEISGQD